MAKYNIKNGTLAARRNNAAANELAASEVEGVLQILSTRGCLYLVSLSGKAKRLGAEQLASRGLGRRGEWVGFEKAHQIWGC